MQGVLELRRRAEAGPSAGRDADLALLLGEYESARRAGRPHFVVVRGPAGVGKSRLVEQLSRVLQGRGVPVFAGPSGREVRRSWGLVRPMVRGLLDWAQRAGVGGAALTELGRALQPLEGLELEPTSEGRLALFDAVVELFGCAVREGALFVLPDLDAADRASVELVRYLAAVYSNASQAGGALFVLSLRDDAPLPAPVEELTRRLTARTVSLSGLDLDGIRAFLGRDEVAQRLLEVTGGRPDALSELLERPAMPVDFFLYRLERLPAGQRDVLEVLAQSPEALAPAAVAEVLEQDVAAVTARLDALVREHFVDVRLVEGQVRARLAREGERAAVEALTPEPRRAQLCRRLGLLLGRAGHGLVAAELLARVSLAEALPAVLAAALEASRCGALEDAAALLRSALRELGGAERAQVAERLGRIAGALGQGRVGARWLLHAGRIGEAESRAGRVLAAAELLLRAGRLSFAAALLRVTAGDARTAETTVALEAELLLRRGHAGEARRCCEAALAGEAVAHRAAVRLRGVLGRALLVQGHAAEALECFATNVTAAGDLGLTTLAAQARLNEGVAAYRLGDVERAEAAWSAAGVEDRASRAVAEANLGSLYAERGDFEAALRHLNGALEAFARFGTPREEALAASNLARLHHFLGDLPRADELCERSRRLAGGEGYVVAGAALTQGAVALDGQRALDALLLLDEARQGFEAAGNDGYAALASALAARAHLTLGERLQAEGELRRHTVDAGAAALPAARLEVELARGELYLSRQDLLEAGRALARAREALLGQVDLDASARVACLAGRLREAAADVTGARVEFERAARLLSALAGRVPSSRRAAFLAMPERARVLAAAGVVAASPERHAADALRALVGSSPALARITGQLAAIGRSNATVLVRGESGTGKELLADALHALSPRRDMPLVKVNCAAMVEELLLSELFGHEKGAFTGATRERKGRFELADGGTIFLDEIGDISPKAQVALLRVLQEREFERVGGNRTLKVDVRVVCATNRDLEALIAEGRFRMDLYYRLKGVSVELPSLRQRLEDLPVLARHFLAKTPGGVGRRLSPGALGLLARHSWPGNVRELENVIEAAAIFADGPVVDVDAFMHVAELRALVEAPASAPDAVESMPPTVGPPPRVEVGPAQVAPQPAPPSGPLDYYELARQRGISLKDLRREVEMQCIRRALIEAGGNISEAARLLGMKRSRLSQIVNAEAELREVAHGE